MNNPTPSWRVRAQPLSDDHDDQKSTPSASHISRPIGTPNARDRRVGREEYQVDPERKIVDGHILFVGNLPHTAEKHDVENLFSEAGYEV